jgi:hypothetical protein
MNSEFYRQGAKVTEEEERTKRTFSPLFFLSLILMVLASWRLNLRESTPAYVRHGR